MARPASIWLASLLLLPVLGLVAPSARAREEASGADAAEMVEILRLDEATVVRTTARGKDVARIALLADGDLATGAEVAATRDAPLEIVYGFGGKDVTLESIQVHLPAGDPDQGPTASVELLASSLSAHSGFRTIRTCTLRGPAKNPQCSFMQTRARFVMLRVMPAPGFEQTHVAEVSIGGHRGAPASRYAFKHTPARSIEVLAQLKRLIKGTITPDERSLFEDAADGKLDRWTFAEAALIASGITARGKRKGYLKRIAGLEAEARAAVGTVSDPYAKGERLLRWLHKTPMSRGYVEHQTDLSVLLDTGTFNCVSSATLYNILGRRMGLDVRAIEVPDHAFSILYKGTRHADVEVTTEDGFNPSRNPAAMQAFEERTGFSYIPDEHPESRREVGDAGLVAIIYYNHAVGHMDKQRFDDALLSGFCALSLDPEFSSAVKSVLGSLANWSVHLAEKQRFADAIAVLNTGLTLAPTDATLLNNRTAVWQARIDAAVDAKRTQDALRMLKTAHDQVPDAGFQAMQAWVFVKRAEEMIDDGQWEAAIALAASGIPEVGPEAQQQLASWRGGAYGRWANQYMQTQAFGPALAVIEKGLAAVPTDGHLAHNLAFVAQEHAAALREAGQPEQAEAMLLRLLAGHPRHAKLRGTATTYAAESVTALTEAGEHAQAVAALDRTLPLVTTVEERKILIRTVYDGWGRKLDQAGRFEASVGVYDRALGKLPGDAHLLTNRRVIVGHWADAHMQAGEWLRAGEVLAAAARVDPEGEYLKHVPFLMQEAARSAQAKGGTDAAAEVIVALLALFPKSADARRVAKTHFSREALAQVDAGAYAEALRVADQAAKTLGDKSFRDVARGVYDSWADALRKANQWSEATQVYVRALQKFPGDEHLTANAKYTWHAWSVMHIEKKAWRQAIEVLEDALTQFPGDATFKQNLAYAKQELK